MRPLLAALCLLLANLSYVEAGHECGHIPPQRVGYSATTSSRTRRQASERQPIRIEPVYYKDDFNQLTPDQRTKYEFVVVQAINYLSSFLKVERLTQNLTLQRFCNSCNQLGSLNPFDHCTLDEPCQTTYCALPEYQIPEEHLKACKTCETVGSTNCSTDGQDGPGGPDADIVIYVAARNLQCGSSTLAYAAHCFQDRSTDRPIAGVVNLCPKLASETDIDNIVLTVAHELIHALVFSPILIPFYRDENGTPRTPRNNITGLPTILGTSPIFTFQPSADTILQENVEREAINGVYDIDTVKVVTPAVLREARRHFGCPTLNGMELENLGGEGTRYFHWKKKLVEVLVSIAVGEAVVPCQSAGEELLVQADGFVIVVICPAFDDICWENFPICPSATSAPPTVPATTSGPSTTTSIPPSGPSTTSPPPSGLSTDGAIAIGVIFGLLGLVAFAIIVVVVVVVAVMCKYRGKSSSGRKGRPAKSLASYRLEEET